MKDITYIGALLIDKPERITSNQLLQKVKKTLDLKKAGHTGTLDPLASGLMVFCFNQATKFIPHLLNADKKYEFTIKLGEKTDTADREGNIIAQKKLPDLDQLNIHYIQSKCNQLVGEIQQIPPMYSAVKHQGQRLYKLARNNISIKRKSRTIHIYQLQCLSVKNEMIKMKVHGSKGLYVRSLGESIAQQLDCFGHIHELRRTHIANLFVNQACQAHIDLDSNQQKIHYLKYLKPIDSLLTNLPSIQLPQSISNQLLLGKKIQCKLPYSENKPIKYYRHSKLMGLLEYSGHQLQVRKNISF